MNMDERIQLWDRLLSAGLVTGELPPETASPWYIRGMLGIAGWIGAFFLLGFVGIAFEAVMRSSVVAAMVAIACCGGAFCIFRMLPKSDFAGQFGLAIGLVGQILFGVAIFKEFNGNQAGGYFLFLLVEAVLTVIMPSFMHRIFTTLAAVGSLCLWFAQTGLHGLALPLLAAGCACLWRFELRLSSRLDLWQPVRYGLALGLVTTTALSLLGEEKQFWLHNGDGGWLLHHAATVETALFAAIFLAVTVTILRELAIDVSGTTGIVILLCATAVMAASFPIHGLAVALLVAVLGFSGGNRILLALGILAFGVFIITYYYQMQETLLYKASMLGATGVLLLATRHAVRLLPARGVRSHA